MVAVHIPGPEGEGSRVMGIAVAARLPGRSVRMIDAGLSLVSAVKLQKAGAEALTAISIVAV
jgi:hypothetical protein